MNNLDTVPFNKVKRMLESVEFHFKDEPERLNDLNLSFEYLVGSCFPDVVNNVRGAIADARTEGYIDGMTERLAPQVKQNGASNSYYGKNDLKKIRTWLETVKKCMEDELVGYEVYGDGAKCIQFVERQLDEMLAVCNLCLGGKNET